MTVTGKNVDAAAEPIIVVTVIVTRFNSDDNDTTTETIVASEVLTCDALYQEILANTFVSFQLGFYTH